MFSDFSLLQNTVEIYGNQTWAVAALPPLFLSPSPPFVLSSSEAVQLAIIQLSLFLALGFSRFLFIQNQVQISGSFGPTVLAQKRIFGF